MENAGCGENIPKEGTFPYFVSSYTGFKIINLVSFFLSTPNGPPVSGKTKCDGMISIRAYGSSKGSSFSHETRANRSPVTPPCCEASSIQRSFPFLCQVSSTLYRIKSRSSCSFFSVEGSSGITTLNPFLNVKSFNTSNNRRQ